MEPSAGAVDLAQEEPEGTQGTLRVPGGAVILVKSGFYEGLEVCVDRDW